MTTPPKARRFHASPDESVRPVVSRPASAQADATGQPIRIAVTKKADLPPRFGRGPADHDLSQDDRDAQYRDELARMTATPEYDDGFGSLTLNPSAPDSAPQDAAPKGATSSPAGPDADLDARIAAIRCEKLTERQLRIAQRIAALHQIPFASGEEAVLRLRERGIDPSHRAALGQILSAEGNRAQAAPGRNVPLVMPQTSLAPPPPASTEVGHPRPNLPSQEALTEDRRAAEIYKIQRDIAVRRRKRLAMLSLRLLCLVILPTFLAGWYYYRIASPLYATISQFQIQMAESPMGGGGGLLGGSQMLLNPDAVAVQSYLTSRDAMLRLDQDLNFKEVFQRESIDPIKRLAPDATNEAAYKIYKNSVRIGYDPTEGLVDMEVIAPDPRMSEAFSRSLIGYAEEQVDRMTSRVREDQMQGARQNYEDAEAKVLAAQQRVQDAQTRLGILDPVAESGVVMGQITSFEMQLSAKRLELGQLLSNSRPVESRVAAIRGDIRRLEEIIVSTRSQLTEGNEQRTSLAAVTGEMRIAESDLATREQLLAGAAEQMEAARIEANKQVRYLSLSVAPVPPDEATYPKAFQNTLVAFLLFSGIYLMMSLTVSILREQVST